MSPISYRTNTPDLYILDFLDLKDTYSEKDLENAILSELERFILEMGNDFAFLARQKRITNELFEKIGKNETRRDFETAYKFVSGYKNLGEQYILSAKVQLDL